MKKRLVAVTAALLVATGIASAVDKPENEGRIVGDAQTDS